MGAEDDISGGLYQRFPVTVVSGEGCRVRDDAGKEYLDCMGGYGVALVGHRNGRVVRAVREQLDRIITVHSSLYSPARAGFLEALVAAAPEGLGAAHLSNSGAEAVEAAIKFARKFTGRKKAVAMRGGYHGKSLGALSVTHGQKYRRSFEPLPGPVEFVPFGDADALRRAVDEDTAFAIIEPVQGESGVRPAPGGFLREAREACDRAGALLVFDEIQSGLGRTGRMWAAEHWGTAPDVMCLAKGIAGGIPMGATLARPDVVAAMGRGEHSSTFGGNPLACAAGSATLRALAEDGLVENAAEVGGVLLEGLREMAGRRPSIREVRGMGLMIGVEIRFDVRDILHGAIRDEGLLMLYSGRNTLRLLPPLVATRDDARLVLGAVDRLLSAEEGRRGIAGGGDAGGR